jgi:hypothetical protein
VETGIFGLVGVLLGGLLTFGVQWWRERRADRRAKLAATRLVAVEMRHGGAAIRHGRLKGKWWHEPIDFDEWGRQAEILTAVLSREEWLTVRRGYDELRAAERTRAANIGTTTDVAQQVDLVGAEKAVTVAIEALERHDPQE